jgi:mono/diheme cytochrome c family protein
VLFKRLSFLLIIPAFLLTSCSEKEKDIDPEQLQRLTVIRDELKKELGDTYNQPVPHATPEQVQRGEQLYDQVCASCHGLSGKGLIHTSDDIVWKPADFTDKEQASFFSERARLQIIRNGIKGTPMIGWSNILTEDDILAVYQYIKSMSEG